eukprot:scaffold8070_cov117-Cylindrotheca_fusiformis.AAC.14
MNDAMTSTCEMEGNYSQEASLTSGAQHNTVAVCSILSAISSIFGSSLFLRLAVKPKRKRKWTPCTRLMVGLIICDIISSAILGLAGIMLSDENRRVAKCFSGRTGWCFIVYHHIFFQAAIAMNSFVIMCLMRKRMSTPAQSTNPTSSGQQDGNIYISKPTISSVTSSSSPSPTICPQATRRNVVLADWESHNVDSSEEYRISAQNLKFHSSLNSIGSSLEPINELHESKFDSIILSDEDSNDSSSEEGSFFDLCPADSRWSSSSVLGDEQDHISLPRRHSDDGIPYLLRCDAESPDVSSLPVPCNLSRQDKPRKIPPTVDKPITVPVRRLSPNTS